MRRSSLPLRKREVAAANLQPWVEHSSFSKAQIECTTRLTVDCSTTEQLGREEGTKKLKLASTNGRCWLPRIRVSSGYKVYAVSLIDLRKREEKSRVLDVDYNDEEFTETRLCA